MLSYALLGSLFIFFVISARANSEMCSGSHSAYENCFVVYGLSLLLSSFDFKDNCC